MNEYVVRAIGCVMICIGGAMMGSQYWKSKFNHAHKRGLDGIEIIQELAEKNSKLGFKNDELRMSNKTLVEKIAYLTRSNGQLRKGLRG